MTLKNHCTPLSALPGMTVEKIAELRDHYWICSVEDLYGYAGSQPDSTIAGSDSCEAVLGVETCRGLSSLQIPAREMGFRVSEDECNETLADCRRRLSAKTMLHAGSSRTLGGTGPSAVRLTDRMPPIRDQAARGTCTAFASVALCEFAQGGGLALSPQFLYWACKERDGAPHSDGTSLATVQEALDEAGVCEDRLWTYCPVPRYGADGLLDAGQGPAPRGTEDNALGHRQRCQALTPKAPAKYRGVIASGRPVVVGVLAFNSWVRNSVTEVTGRVFMPHMRKTDDGIEICEKCIGGHAMCLVGYVDAEAAPGGGYFIARNSWGTGWAAECVEGAGHALIPYRYLDLFAVSAFTVSESDENLSRGDVGEGVFPASVSHPDQVKVPPYLEPFARTLTYNQRDFKGTYLSPGKVVLSLKPGDPVYEFSERNASEPGYQAIFAAAKYKLLAKGDATVALQRKNEFCDKIDANFHQRNLRFRAFPSMSVSWRVLPENVGFGIGKVELVADFSGDLLNAMLKDLADAGVSCSPPEAWRNQIGNLTVGKIFCVTSAVPVFSQRVYVVEAFAVPFAVDPKSGCVEPAKADIRLIEIVKNCARRCLPKWDGGIFFAVGTGCKAVENFEVPQGGADYVALSCPEANGGWRISRSGYLRDLPAYRDFCDRLMPLTEEELLSETRKIVDPLVLEPGMFDSGAVFVRRDIIPKLRERYSGFPDVRQTTVIGVLRQMRNADPKTYAIMQNAKGEVFVVKDKRRVLPGDRPYRRLSWFGRFATFYAVHLLCWLPCVACSIYYRMCGQGTGWGMSLLFLALPSALSIGIIGLVRRIVVAERN